MLRRAGMLTGAVYDSGSFGPVECRSSEIERRRHHLSHPSEIGRRNRTPKSDSEVGPRARVAWPVVRNRTIATTAGAGRQATTGVSSFSIRIAVALNSAVPDFGSV